MDLLRSDPEPLLGALAGVGRLVLLGDIVELRQSPPSSALDAARPVLQALGAALAPDAEVVLVPGNHDHLLISTWEQGRSLRETAALGLENRLSPAGSSPAAELMAGWLGPSRTSVAYPGLWLSEEVYATHGHYLDCHSELPTIERLAAGVMQRALGAIPAAGALPDHYEDRLAPLYAFSDAVARGSASTGRAPHGVSAGAWRALSGEAGRPLRARALAAAFPLGVGALNRAGLGPVSPALDREQFRRVGHVAMGQVVSRLGVRAEHVVFGHTHRAGPLDGEDRAPWSAGGALLHNAGCWVRDPRIMERGRESPFYPGACVALDDGGAPEVRRLL